MAVPKIYKDFYEQKVFTFESLKEKYRKDNTLGSLRILLHNCKVNGYIGTVKGSLYYIIPQEFSKENYTVDKYLIASKLTSTDIVAYHSALELLGVAQSAFNRVFILTQQRISSFDFQGTTFIGVTGNIGFGYTTIVREGVSIRVTDRERTLIDGIDRLKYVGGLEEYLKSIKSFPSVSFQRIEEYLKRYQKVGLYSKVGFLLSFFKERWTFPDDVRRRLRSKVKKKVYYLTQTKGKAEFNKEWNLMVPRNLRELILAA
jgi:predicted transcriptional regulator of viral defense system